MRVILPVLVGAILGALVVGILLGSDGAEDRSSLAIPAEPSAAPPTTEAAREPDNEPSPGGADTAVTLGELSAITDPAARRAAALALLDRYGYDAAGIDAVAAALAPAEAVNFGIHAIVRLSASDIPGAFAAAMALPELEQRRLALSRLAPALAATDPLAAIAASAAIDSPDLETEFMAALLDAWAVTDPARVFGYLESAEPTYLTATETLLALLAASDPERLLAMAGDLRRDIAASATTAAIEALIERDLPEALAHIAALPQGSDRARLEATATELYGERDPAAAWEWVTATGADALARLGVVSGVQKVDPDMAWNLMLGQLNSADPEVRAGTREYVMNYVNAVVNSASPDDVVIGLDRLLSLNDARIDSQMHTNLQAWANRDPEAALEWTLRNVDRIDSTRLLSSLSAGLARTNIELARQTVFSLDEERRKSWASGVGRTLATNDLAAARSWAYEFPTGPLRDAGLAEVVRGEAMGGTVDPQLFAQFSDDRARDEAASVAARRFACDGRVDLALEISRTYIADERLLDQTVGQIEGTAPGGVTMNQFMCGFL